MIYGRETLRNPGAGLMAGATDVQGVIRYWALASAVWMSVGFVPHFVHAFVTFHVSPTGDDGNQGDESAPFQSIERAQAAVRSLTEHMTSDITVILQGGRYQLADTVRFDHRDSGMNGFHVVYRSLHGEQAVLSGGHQVTGWVVASNGLARADAGANRFRQFYVNGVRATRARTPNSPEFARLLRWDESNRQIVVPPSSVASWSDLSSVEIVVLKEWTQNNLRVESVIGREEGLFILPQEPDRTKAFQGHLFLRTNAQSYFFENALELLDAPGEWYLRTSTEEVFYRPREMEDVTRAIIMVPRLEQLLDVNGTAGKPVHDLTFVGLTFELSGWMQPSEEGFAVSQADVIDVGANSSVGQIAAAVNVTHAHHVRFERNTFQHLGGAGLALHTDITDVQVIGNRFQDLSAGGIVVDTLLDPRPLDPRLVCRDIVIANNLIEEIGLDYRSSVGIFAGFVSRTSIEHNEIHDAPYTGISVGWGWTDMDTVLGQNRIVGNHIFHVMTAMADGAGIYTLSKQPGTIIHENYVHDLERSPWAGNFPISGIYLDEGSRDIVVSGNVLERVPMGLDFHSASKNLVVNTDGSHHERTGSAENIFLQEPGFSPHAVKARAGLEPAYSDIRTLTGFSPAH